MLTENDLILALHQQKIKPEPKSKEAWAVYFFPERTTNASIKIGYSKNPLARIKQLQTGHSQRIGSEGWFVVDSEEEARKKEAELHSMFKKYRIRNRNEWFLYTDTIKKYITDNLRKENFFRYFC